MKKYISVFFIIIVSILFTNNALAYSNDKYSIDIPNGYSQVSENSFTNEDGYNINVQISPFSDDITGDLYTESNLEEIVDSFEEEAGNYKDKMKNVLNESNKKNGNVLTQNDINEYVKSFKIEVIKKEITTFTKNEYKCFHIVSKCSMSDTSFYISQYGVVSGKDLYILTITSKFVTDFDYSSKITNTIDSFTIKDFKPYQETSFIGDLIANLMLTVIAFELGPFVLKVIKRKTFSKKDAAIISTVNSIIVQIIIVGIQIYLMSIFDDEIRFNFAPAFVYGSINYYWLQHKVKNRKKVEIKSTNNEGTEAEKSMSEFENVDDNDISTENKEQEEILNDNNKVKKIKGDEVKELEVMVKYCSSCGKKVKEDWDFCNYCGNKLK